MIKRAFHSIAQPIRWLLRPRWRRYLVIFTLLALAIWSLAAAAVYFYGWSDRATPSDAIVILGAGVRPDGSPNGATVRRARHGAALYKRGMAPVLICTGGYSGNQLIQTEAGACAAILQRLGVPASAILLEQTSTSTEENAIEAHKIMQSRGLHTVIIVTDNYHIFRSETLFRDQGIQAVASAAQLTSGPLPVYWRFFGSYREIVALVWQVFKTAVGLNATSSPF
jgi:uncharacterized SAM-binding protein YcdF (DUF218 family)